MSHRSTLHLDAPPAFRGLHPVLPVSVYRRHLPHWRQAGATCFVRFRLGDAYPQKKLNFLRRLRDRWETTNPSPRSKQSWETFAKEYTTLFERWLDQGYGVCHFRKRQRIDDLVNRLKHFHDQRYLLSCWAILPSHCHAVIKPRLAGLESEQHVHRRIHPERESAGWRFVDA